MSTPTAVRKDSENLAIIERLKPKHSAELNKLIRLEAELDRGERDLEELLAQLEQGWGTRDLDKVRDIIRQNYASNSEKVDEWVAGLTAVTDGLAALEAKV
ncbi:hypothetical protein OIU34_24855 [Pararhizobium sp. BT-229]|uniref:hypothetical protein n=1 Tax=Pararhizobium sp. BT-229 TaxID=2986923 RepID=UPI0021F78E77|nr:hypothetical protein [Pararhizobium sp. BT-229]MCV9965116.1 hypothetical protein [Pararhizobium sp. BT-229]